MFFKSLIVTKGSWEHHNYSIKFKLNIQANNPTLRKYILSNKKILSHEPSFINFLQVPHKMKIFLMKLLWIRSLAELSLSFYNSLIWMTKNAVQKWQPNNICQTHSWNWSTITAFVLYLGFQRRRWSYKFINRLHAVNTNITKASWLLLYNEYWWMGLETQWWWRTV